MTLDDREIKQAALIGLRHQQQQLADLLQRLERELGTVAAKASRRKRRLSAAGRANIVAALKKRWAAARKAKAAPKPKQATKRALSKAPRRAPAKPVVKKPAGKTKTARNQVKPPGQTEGQGE